MIFAATPPRTTPSDGLLVRDPDGLANQTNKKIKEATLNIKSIQGMILTGFNKDFRHLIFLKVKAHTPTRLKAFKKWLKAESDHVATAAEVIAFNRLFQATRTRRGGEGTIKSTWMAVALSQKLLNRLTGGDAKFADKAFMRGLAKRSKGLGDPDGNHKYAPNNWLVGGEHNEADMLVVIEADDSGDLGAHTARFFQAVDQANKEHSGLIEEIFRDQGGNPQPPLSGHEHFGFLDGVSQPGIRGLLSKDESDPLTYRQNPHRRDQLEHPRKRASKDNLLQPAQGKPGQDLLHPGEFIFNYPRQTSTSPKKSDFSDSPNPKPGLNSLKSVPQADGTVLKKNAGPAWAKDGSFLVYRRLRQDVGAFHKFLFETGKKLTKPLAHDSASRFVGSQLVGRWPSGCPVLRSSDIDIRGLGDDDCANNNFEFGGPTPEILKNPKDPAACVDTKRPHSAGDTDGAKCPFTGHIRKAYPRDDETKGSEFPNESNTQTHRLLRRGLPYGPVSNSSFDSPDVDGDSVDRGLQFLCFQTSIENQFEFVIKRWINNRNFKEKMKANPGSTPATQGGGLDPILGQNRGAKREFNIMLPDANGVLKPVRLSTDADWVHPTAGGYFFTPSLEALKGVLTK
jgi:Dyp-type peroxidase family